MSMLHAPSQTVDESKAVWAGHHCPECLTAFVAGHPRQLFCSAAHRDRFHNRATVRGRSLVPLQMAARLTRGGSRRDTATGIRARQDCERLLDRWNADDRSEGRMPMDAYVRLRLAKGFETA